MAVEILFILLALSAVTIGVIQLIAYLFPYSSSRSSPYSFKSARAVRSASRKRYAHETNRAQRR